VPAWNPILESDLSSLKNNAGIDPLPLDRFLMILETPKIRCKARIGGLSAFLVSDLDPHLSGIT
jgi:hypothetical protein